MNPYISFFLSFNSIPFKFYSYVFPGLDIFNIFGIWIFCVTFPSEHKKCWILKNPFLHSHFLVSSTKVFISFLLQVLLSFRRNIIAMRIFLRIVIEQSDFPSCDEFLSISENDWKSWLSFKFEPAFMYCTDSITLTLFIYAKCQKLKSALILFHVSK